MKAWDCTQVLVRVRGCWPHYWLIEPAYFWLISHQLVYFGFVLFLLSCQPHWPRVIPGQLTDQSPVGVFGFVLFLLSCQPHWPKVIPGQLTDQSPVGVFGFGFNFLLSCQPHWDRIWLTSHQLVYLGFVLFLLSCQPHWPRVIPGQLTDQSPVGVFGFVLFLLSCQPYCCFYCPVNHIVVFIVLSTIFTQGHPRTADWPEHWEYSQMFVIGPPQHTHTHTPFRGTFSHINN